MMAHGSVAALAVLLLAATASAADEEDIFPIQTGTHAGERALAPAAARKYGVGYTLAANGREIVVDTGGDTGVNAGAAWTVTFNQKEPRPLAVSAQAFPDKADDGGDFQIFVDVTYNDDTCLWGQTAVFDRLISVGWHERTVTIQPIKPIRYIVVYTMLRQTASRVRFRDVRVRELEGNAANLFDSVAVTPRMVPKEPCFIVRDAAARDGFARFKADGTAKGLTLVHTRTERDGAQFFEATLSKQTRGDRAATLVYAVPLPEGELTWHVHPRESRPLAGVVTEVRNTLFSTCGAGGLSHWPFGAVTAGGKGMALGLDPAGPAYFRTAVNPALRLLYIAFDLGLAEERPDARVRFCLFPFEAANRFRGAFEAYMRLFPEAFAVRQRRHGIWMAFNKVSAVQGWEDFGFAIKEGDNETAWDDAHGLTTFRYTEPGTWWMRIGPRDGQAPSMEDCIAEAVRRSRTGDDAALAWWTSVCRDERGKPVGMLLNTPWCNGMVWSMNSAPGIRGDVTDFSRKIGGEAFDRRYGGTPPQGLDGEYVDSADLYVTTTLDFDRAHFGVMRTPLCFSRTSSAPGVFKGMVAYEYVRSLAERLHPQGRLVMANSTPIRWCWLAPYLDVMGYEIDWNKKDGWRPTNDEQMLFHRAMCGGKPFCYLMNTDLTTFTHEKMERFMMRAIAYGLFPGVFSKTTSGRHYFDWPELYNRDRDLFKKYVPICQVVSEAGWRPVNRVLETDDERVFLEQFGPEVGSCFVTVFNDTREKRTVALRLKDCRRAPTRELVTGDFPVWASGVATVTLPPESLRVLAW